MGTEIGKKRKYKITDIQGIQETIWMIGNVKNALRNPWKNR